MVTMKQWERAETRKRHAENLRMRLLYTGHAETNFLQFLYNQKAKTVTVRSSKGSFTVTCEKFRKIQWALYMLDVPENLPLLFDNAERRSASWNGVRPQYGPREPTMAEKYAERLRQDRWNIRRNGDPCNWKLANI